VAAAILQELGTPLLIHEPLYSILNRRVEPELLDVLGEEGIGRIAFPPVAQGMLTGRYLGGRARGLRGEPGRIALAVAPDRRGAREDPRVERDRGAPRLDTRATGARLRAP
jgi:aryl-alcohol dehydrogenase-like predicted oxidoreductase